MSEPGAKTDQPDLTRLIVNLTPNAAEAMNVTAALLGDTRIDTINRSLMLYGAIANMVPGGKVSFNLTKDGKRMTLQRLHPLLTVGRAMIFSGSVVAAFIIGLIVG